MQSGRAGNHDVEHSSQFDHNGGGPAGSCTHLLVRTSRFLIGDMCASKCERFKKPICAGACKPNRQTKRVPLITTVGKHSSSIMVCLLNSPRHRGSCGRHGCTRLTLGFSGLRSQSRPNRASPWIGLLCTLAAACRCASGLDAAGICPG